MPEMELVVLVVYVSFAVLGVAVMVGLYLVYDRVLHSSDSWFTQPRMPAHNNWCQAGRYQVI
jgi:hypothetical protein